MPSLISSSIDDLSQAITDLPNADRQKLTEKLSAAAAAESKDRARKANLARIEAAANDERKVPAIRFCAGALKRAGLTIEAAADMNLAQLDEALAKSRATTDEKFQIKTAMRRIGILGTS